MGLGKNEFDGGLTCALKVADLGKAIEWYKNVLGFELLYHKKEMGWCELRSPVQKVNVGLSEAQKMEPLGGNAVLTWGVHDIEESKKKLAAQKVKFDGDILVIPGLTKLLTFFDPDGNCFMLYQDTSNSH